MRYYEFLNEKFTNENLQYTLIINHPNYDESKEYNYELIINYWKNIDKCVFWLFSNPSKLITNNSAMAPVPWDRGYYYFETIPEAISFYRIFQVAFDTKFNNYSTMDINTFIKLHGDIWERDRIS